MGAVLEETYDSGVVAFLILCTALVFIMVPGLGFLYSGLARRKSALSLIWAVLMACCVGIFQWYFWGYSLAFSKTATNKFIGNLDSFGFRDVYGKVESDDQYPELVFANYQNMFLCVTLAIIAGATAERGRLLPHMVFLFLWATLVYSPIVCWIWSSNGWAASWGVLDYAGGGPVEIGSGVGGFVYSWFLGKRKEKLLINFRPHNVSLITLGTVLLWFGWLGFNGGSAFAPTMKAMMAIMNTNLTASFAAMTWCLLDYRLEKKWSTVGLCSGLVSGLVSSTPASGMITPYGSVILGIVTGIVCNFSTGLKYLVGVDDSLDILAEHGIAGMLGLFFNALFAADWIIGMDGSTEHPGGFISHNYKQIYKQIAFIAACTGYVAVVTSLICFVIDKIPGLKLRANEYAEAAGMDEDQIGEFAYDYVEVRRDFLSWGNNNQMEQNQDGSYIPNPLNHQDDHIPRVETHDGENGESSELSDHQHLDQEKQGV
ncbi:Ammonium transporter MEP3 [Wickerhamomyces ciferrii]|uniref:Ammonium transporter n=1 Tax=Wickerhamomyces ciferrii (strain ATCC 14091 / BCRC 22168 / CBS 111 / JCM 3599 / NBRC 0793 / NRRL Y-1031 F-60-10) TaxID=1206466 RepID=K0KNZ4_WICCF|nr:Ammonium transporter MEP3 [Wickerhamomyces ciferrii]CCH42823.1 Ammonium transporter MEP3 [Wickerhamomyces ciferrii]